MRSQRTSNSSLPGDGLIKLAPGASFGFDVDVPLVPSIDQLRRWFMEIRGFVLSTSFGIENEFVLLALADEFGSNSAGDASQVYFEREQAHRELNGIERKIELIKPVIRRRCPLEAADRLIQNIAQFRELRNLLSHYPCWFEPINDVRLIRGVEREITVELRTFIADRTHVWRVDKPQVREWTDLLSKVRISIENLRREIIGAPLLLPDGSLPPNDEASIGPGSTQRIKHGGVTQLVNFGADREDTIS